MIGGAHHAHDGDLLPPGKHGQLDGVGDDKDGHRSQHGDQCIADGVDHAAHLYQFIGKFLFAGGAGDAVDLFQGIHCLLVERHILHNDPVTIPQGIVVFQTFQYVGVVSHLLLIILQGFFLGDKFHRLHIVHLFDFLFQGLGLGTGVGLIHPQHDFALGLQIGHLDSQVVGHQAEAGGDEQAGGNDRDGRHRHQPMGKEIADALFQIISQIKTLHQFDTRFSPNRRNNRRCGPPLPGPCQC